MDLFALCTCSASHGFLKLEYHFRDSYRHKLNKLNHFLPSLPAALYKKTWVKKKENEGFKNIEFRGWEFMNINKLRSFIWYTQTWSQYSHNIKIQCYCGEKQNKKAAHLATPPLKGHISNWHKKKTESLMIIHLWWFLKIGVHLIDF